MNTKKLITILSLVIGSTSVNAVCWSKDYPCCKQDIDINTVAIYQDPDTNHYYSNEDGHICAVVIGDQDKCPSGDNYPCCSTCNVIFTDQEEWGVENDTWCSIPFACHPNPTRTTLSLPPIVATPGADEICSKENEPCGGTLYEGSVSGCCEEGFVCYKRSAFYHYCVSKDIYEEYQQPEVTATTTTTSVSAGVVATPNPYYPYPYTTNGNTTYFFPPPPPPPPFFGNFDPNCSRPYDLCETEGYPDCCPQGFKCTLNESQNIKQCLEDPDQAQLYPFPQNGNGYYPPPPPPQFIPVLNPDNTTSIIFLPPPPPPPYPYGGGQPYPGQPGQTYQPGQPVHGEGNPGDMYPYNPQPGQPGGYYPPPYYPPPYYPPTTTTTKTKPTACAKAYYPCGGNDFPDAPNCCQEGYYCNTDNPDFFMCKEIEKEVTTTTTTVAPTATATPVDKCAAVFDMCGGSKFKDAPDCCQKGSFCLKVSAEYSQCIPDEFKGQYSDYDAKKTTTAAAAKTTTTTAAAAKTTTTTTVVKTTTTAAANKTTTTTAAAAKTTTTTAAAAKTTTTTAAKATTTAAAASNECAKVYETCGGVNHTGPTCCEPGTKCIVFNQYHHQCIPDDAEGYDDFA